MAYPKQITALENNLSGRFVTAGRAWASHIGDRGRLHVSIQYLVAMPSKRGLSNQTTASHRFRTEVNMVTSRRRSNLKKNHGPGRYKVGSFVTQSLRTLPNPVNFFTPSPFSQTFPALPHASQGSSPSTSLAFESLDIHFSSFSSSRSINKTSTFIVWRKGVGSSGCIGGIGKGEGTELEVVGWDCTRWDGNG